MAMVFTLGRMEIAMKDNGECVLNTDKGQTIFAMEISTSVSILMVNLMEKENIFGVLDKFIQVNFIKGLNKVGESGGVAKINPQLQIFTKVSIIMIKNMVKEFLLGLLEIFIKVIILKMNVIEMDKCYGLMVVCMKENGKKEYSMVLEG